MTSISKFGIPLIIIMLLTTTSLITPDAEAIKIRDIQPSLTIEGDTNDFGLIEPNGDEVTTTLKIIYEYGGFILPLRREPTTVTLTIESQPDWCDVQLDNEVFEIPVNTIRAGSGNATAELTVKIINSFAPAFEIGEIVINATADLNVNLLPAYAEYTIRIKPDFVPIIDTIFTNNTITLASDEKTNISIIVTNLGNSQITAKIAAAIDNSDNFEIIMPLEETIEVKEQKIFNIQVKAIAPDNKTNITEMISFTVSYHASSDPTLIGDHVILVGELILENEISEPFELDNEKVMLILLVVFVIIIIIQLVVIISLKRK